jgi:hypothetical protein
MTVAVTLIQLQSKHATQLNHKYMQFYNALYEFISISIIESINDKAQKTHQIRFQTAKKMFIKHVQTIKSHLQKLAIIKSVQTKYSRLTNELAFLLK